MWGQDKTRCGGQNKKCCVGGHVVTTGLENLFIWLLKEAVVTADERKEEQKKFGIYFDDDYDYLQHLQEPGLAVSSEVCCVCVTANGCVPVCVCVCVCSDVSAV